MLRALIERGITPDLIVGVSIGAWNGAWLAYRPELEWVKQLEQVWRQVSRRTLDMVWWRAARNMVRRKPSLYEGGGLSRFVARHLQVHNFEDLAVPLHTVAIDLTMGTKAVFSHGPLAPAVLASSAIPGVFPPVIIDGRQHVDGGLVDPTGLDTAIATSFKAVLANPGPMALWGLTVALVLLAGSALAFVGLMVAVPVLGHATWHLYRKLIA